jgi:hypothetical protein
MEESHGCEFVGVAVDGELEVVLQAANVAMEPTVVCVDGCLGIERLLCYACTCTSVMLELISQRLGPTA